MNRFRGVRILKINPEEPEQEAISIAAEVLQEGGLVAFPTETVYGLGANLLNEKAIERLYKVKKRPREKPFTIHISSLDIAKDMVSEISFLAQGLIDEFWPGPLTLIFNSKDRNKKIGFRIPDCKIAHLLIEQSGIPVVAPSANISGNRPPRSPIEVLEDLGDKVDMILDGGPTRIGIESTVVDTTVFPYRVLREGAITKARLKDAWNHCALT